MTEPDVHPLDDAVLVDYWFADLADEDEERVEGHLLECDACGDRLQRLIGIGAGVRHLAGQGAFAVVVSALFVDTALRRGLTVRQYVASPGSRVDCTITAADDLLVSRLRADFTGAGQVDLVSELEGLGQQRVTDLPVDPAAQEVIVAADTAAVRALGRAIVRMRLVAPGPGGDRVLGEYTFDHQPDRD